MSKTSYELALDLAVEITQMCDNIKGRSDAVRQITRAASSVSANLAEARYAESSADFVHKLRLAQKECFETETWLSYLYRNECIDEETFKPLRNKCGKIRRILTASITTVLNQNI